MSTTLATILETLPAMLAARPATFWLPEQASTLAPGVDFIFDVINWICYFFFFLIVALLIVFTIKYRRSPENHGGNSDGPTHHTALELTWTIIPLIIVVVIFFMGFRGYMESNTVPRNAYEIEVTAYQWGWNFRHPNGAQSTEELHVPAGRPVKLVMRSNDVIHSLFIPDFRVKRDVVPGRYTYLWFEAPFETGFSRFHWLFCTEYCGDQHSNMNVRVHVLGQADFEETIDDLANWIVNIDDEELWFRAGPRLFTRCSQCHSLDGTPGLGPTWLGMWERTQAGTTRFVDGSTLADHMGPGRIYGTPEDYLRDSILNPGRHLVAPYGNNMPTFRGQLSERGIDALIGMMKRVEEFNPDGSWKGAENGNGGNAQ